VFLLFDGGKINEGERWGGSVRSRARLSARSDDDYNGVNGKGDDVSGECGRTREDESTRRATGVGTGERRGIEEEGVRFHDQDANQRSLT